MEDLLKDFIYINADSINSLHSSMLDKTIEKLSVKETVDAKGGIKASIFSLFAVDSEIRSNSSTETLSTFSPELKLKSLLKYLEDKKLLFFDYNEACFLYSEQILFLNQRIAFNLPQFETGQGVDEVNKTTVVEFETLFADPTDNKRLYTIHMSANLKNFCRSKNVMTNNGHDAYLFKANQGKGLYLGVFGCIKFLGNSFQLRPYAIWL